MGSKHVGCTPKKNQVLLEIGQTPLSKKTNASKEWLQPALFLTLSLLHQQPAKMSFLVVSRDSFFFFFFGGVGALSFSSSAPLLPPEFTRHILTLVACLPHTAGQSLWTASPQRSSYAFMIFVVGWQHNILPSLDPLARHPFSLQRMLCGICWSCSVVQSPPELVGGRVSPNAQMPAQSPPFTRPCSVCSQWASQAELKESLF